MAKYESAKIVEELKKGLKAAVEKDHKVKWEEAEAWVDKFFGFSTIAENTIKVISHEKEVEEDIGAYAYLRCYADAIMCASTFVFAKVKRTAMISADRKEYAKLEHLVISPLLTAITNVICEKKRITHC
ncbi:MAG: hypothetical protein ABH829_04385 [archaeon]